MSLVLLAEPAPGVRVLRLNDPDRRNALSPALQEELRAAVDTVAADPDARALVVTGTGTAFCAGADLASSFGEPNRPVHVLRAELLATYDSFLRVRRLTIPTVAAVQGAAVGAGANLALSCDLRVAGPHAKFGITFTRLGLHPGGGCTHFLVATVGAQRALEILLDGATLTADEAERTGLVLRIEPDPVAAAVDMATRYADLDPHLVADIKHTVAIAATGDFDAVVDFEAWAQASSATDPRVADTVAALLHRGNAKR